jgi:threonyl-tRNA synthetase
VKSIFPFQASCSVIIAAAMAELFPAAQIRSFLATEKCFYCDVIFPFKFQSEMIPLLEERMRGWIKKDLSFKNLDMMPANAAQFLKHYGNPHAAEMLKGQQGIVPIIQLDNFAGLSPGPTLETTGEVQFIKLVTAQLHGTWIRLIGTAAFSKDELKVQIEVCKNMTSHLSLVKDMQLLASCPKGWLWLPKGELLKKVILEKTFKLFSGIDTITTPALNDKDLILCHSSYVKASNRGSAEVVKMSLGGEGLELIDTAEGIVDKIFLPGREESIISFLQIITKFLKIFTFDYEVVIVGKPAKILREALKKFQIESSSALSVAGGEQSGIEFLISDALGRMWTGPRIFFDERSGIVGLSLFYSLERFVALLLEKDKLPFMLQPEQVRILSMHKEYAEEIRETLEKAGYRVTIENSGEALAGRLRRSLHERVPFSIVVGDREKKTQEMTVCILEGRESVTMNLETLMSRLRQLES